MDPKLCPNCARTGKLSKLEYLHHNEFSIALCEDIECSFSYKGQHMIRKKADSPLSPDLLSRLCPEFLPMTILREPRIRYRHLKMLFWLSELRKGDIYCWLYEEVASMAYSRLKHLRGNKEFKYQLIPSAKQMMELTDEEILIGKHVVPDLRKIVTILKIHYQHHLLLEKC